jgi:ABC-type multidrug transport system fused ATPase/permease subunit
MKLFLLIRKYKKGFATVITLVLIENLAWILEPTLFGNLIDAFIEKAGKHFLEFDTKHVLPLVLWVGIYIINSSAGAVRRRLEPRIFQRMLADIAEKISLIAKKENFNVSKTSGLAQLSQEYINFFQYRLPESLEQSISVGGAIIALTIFDYRISIACLIVTLPISIIGQIYNKRVSLYQKDLHDNYENVVDEFSTKKPAEIKRFYLSMSSIQEKIGKWNSFNFGFMRFVLLIIFIVVLYIAIDLDDFSTGNIYSIVAYLWTFVTSMEYIPELLESRTSFKDISNRIKEKEE